MFKFFIRTKPDHTIPIGWFLHVLDICSWHAVKNNFCIVSVSMLFFAIACTKLEVAVDATLHVAVLPFKYLVNTHVS